jgi:hypothetical protein
MKQLLTLREEKEMKKQKTGVKRGKKTSGFFNLHINPFKYKDECSALMTHHLPRYNARALPCCAAPLVVSELSLDSVSNGTTKENQSCAR